MMLEENWPTCDICDEPMSESLDGVETDWNGETGNHITCEWNSADPFRRDSTGQAYGFSEDDPMQVEW